MKLWKLWQNLLKRTSENDPLDTAIKQQSDITGYKKKEQR